MGTTRSLQNRRQLLFFSTLILASFHNYAVDGPQPGAHSVDHFLFSLQLNKNILSVVRVLDALGM